MTTNYEKIKQMSFREMCAWLVSYELFQLLHPIKKDETGYEVYNRLKQWLQQESEK